MKTAFKTLAISISLIAILSSQISQAATRYSVASGNWSATSTWSTTSGGASGASVPVAGDLAIIEGGYQVTVNSTEVCDSIIVKNTSNAGSELLVKDGDLTVNTGVLMTTQTDTFRAKITIKGVGGNAGTMTIQNDLIINAYDGGSDAEFKTTEDGQCTINGNVYLWSDGGKSAEFTIASSGIITVAGNIYMDAADQGEMFITLEGTSQLNIAGNFIRLNNQGDYYGDLKSGQNTVVNYNGTSAQTFAMIAYAGVTDEWKYGEVRINNTAGVTLDANVVEGGDAQVLDDIRIQTGTLNSGGYSIELKNGKTFEIASAATYYTTTTDATGGMLATTTNASHSIDANGTVNFASASAQNVPNPYNNVDYGHVIISGGGDKSLTATVTVAGNLQLTSGDIVLGTNNLIMGNSSAVTGAPGSGSYVQAHSTGKMRKNFNTVTSFTYTIGDDDDYSPMTFTLNAGTTLGGSDYIELNVSDATHANVTGDDYITRYWGVNASGMSAINYNFGAIYTNADIYGNEAGQLSSSWNSVTSKWTGYASVNTGANQIRNTTAITVIPVNFDFTAANGNALPIELMNFDAVLMDQSVSLTWATATEIDNDFFTIERTVNGVDFEEIATIDGAGSSLNQLDYSHMDRNPLPGMSYYRLKQTDIDGAFTYSRKVAINFENTTTLTLTAFPNPAIRGQDLHIRLENAALDKEVLIVVVDQFGRELFSRMIINTDKPVLQAVAPTDNLAPGLYFVISSSASGLLRKKLIVTGSGGSQSSFVQKNQR